MGLIQKITRGGKIYYKLHIQCTEHGSVVVIKTKEKDLVEKVKNRDKNVLHTILGDKYCDKCIFNIDKLDENTNLTTAKKIYSVIEYNL